ncbi:MAG: FHA domain-containing protein [Dehalococcoidia bacterium]|nr:FHA domain-containing protein [Dehalococcoidia bacterium]
MTIESVVGPRLTWSGPGRPPGERLLNEGRIVIGRAQTCDVVLADQLVSREHAAIVVAGNVVTLEDLNSRNGVFLNGERISAPVILSHGDEIAIGSWTFRFLAPPEADDDETTRVIGASDESVTLVAPLPSVDEPPVVTAPVRISPERTAPVAPPPPSEGTIIVPVPVAGTVPDDLLRSPIVSEAAIRASGVEVQLAEYLALGGGIGSFVWVDFLRNAGVPISDIRVTGYETKPYARYERLCSNSQIPGHERLRSNSDSRPDNIWGFPGYAVSEALAELRRGNLAGLGVLWQVFGEPATAETYTPRSGDVFRSMDREAERIGWSQMFRQGRIRAIRKTEEGRLMAVVSESDANRRKHTVIAARFAHLAVGYPAIQLLPDLSKYRETTGDFTRVVNAYEPHDHVYAALRAKGGVALIRGRGIVASRIFQRLWEERRTNPNIVIVHVNRSNVRKGNSFGLARRKVEYNWEFQPFNWPKACWGGELRARLEAADDEERKRLLAMWGGTTTASRSDWRRIIRDGTNEGWIRSEVGEVKEVIPLPDGRIRTVITSKEAGGGFLSLDADYVIDCTGLIARPDRDPLLGDLIRTYNLPLGPLGRLRVANDFEVEGMRHGNARMYAAGAITLGGPYAAVDSFLGLQYAALRSMDSMRAQRAKSLRNLNGFYSFLQWTKWASGIAP